MSDGDTAKPGVTHQNKSWKHKKNENGFENNNFVSGYNNRTSNNIADMQINWIAKHWPWNIRRGVWTSFHLSEGKIITKFDNEVTIQPRDFCSPTQMKGRRMQNRCICS